MGNADRMPVIPAQGILATTTPGMVDGVLLALQKFGSMSFAQVVQPAQLSAPTVSPLRRFCPDAPAR